MKFEVPYERFQYTDLTGQKLEIELDDPLEVLHSGRMVVHSRLRFYGASRTVVFSQDKANPGYDPGKPYRLIPGFKMSGWSETEKGWSIEVKPVPADEREDISRLFLEKEIVEDKSDLIFWS